MEDHTSISVFEMLTTFREIFPDSLLPELPARHRSHKPHRDRQATTEGTHVQHGPQKQADFQVLANGISQQTLPHPQVFILWRAQHARTQDE